MSIKGKDENVKKGKNYCQFNGNFKLSFQKFVIFEFISNRIFEISLSGKINKETVGYSC